MKKILIIITILLAGITVNAQKWYVATTGSDVSGNGSITKPWKTVKHAADTITDANGFAGDTIVLGAGTFSEPVQVVLSDSISLMGAGITSIITTANALDPIILAQSTAEGTSATQSISYIKFDGNSLTAVRGVAVWRRSNVSIHHCTFEDFLSQGASFRGQTNSTGGPTIYATGNKFYNNIITNCSRYTTYGTGCLEIGGQQGMLVYNDTITVEDRGGTSHGYGIKAGAEGYNKGLKIYDNVITVPEYENTGFSFSIELWNCRGGVEIYSNTLKGAIDPAGDDINDDGGYGFAVKIHDNTIGWDAPIAYTTTGIYLEPCAHGGIYIYNNYFKNMQYGIRFNYGVGALEYGFEDIFIYYNIFYNLRTSGAGYTGYAVAAYASVAYSIPVDNIKFLNNVIYNPTVYRFNTGFWISGLTPVSNIEIRNNIIYNAYTPVQFERMTIDDVNIDNNIFYNCFTGILYTTCSVTGNTANNNLTSDPLWVGGSPYSYKLQSTSPAIDAGINVGLTEDYAGNVVPRGGIPDIGAYEDQAVLVPVTGLGWEDVLSKRNFKDDANFKKSRILINAVPITASAPEINTLVGVTSGIQGQLDAKAALAAPVFTGSITITAGDTTVTAAVGKIVYKTSDNHLYVCKQLTAKKWYQLDN